MTARRAVAALAALVLLALAPPSRAEIDWPIQLPLPEMDLAFGVYGGAAFGEDAPAGGLVGLEVSLLEGVFGVHAGLRGHREGRADRVGLSLEATWWYLLMLGAGVQVGWMTDEGGPEVPDTAVTLHVLVALPIPLWRIGEGASGALVIVPYGRPGLRFKDENARGDSNVVGFHDAGLMLKWTSFGF